MYKYSQLKNTGKKRYFYGMGKINKSSKSKPLSPKDKLHIKGSFEDVLKVFAHKANQKTAERIKKKK